MAHQFEIDDRVNTYTFIVPYDCGNIALLRQEPSRIAAREREEAAARAAAAKADADRAAAAKATPIAPRRRRLRPTRRRPTRRRPIRRQPTRRPRRRRPRPIARPEGRRAQAEEARKAEEARLAAEKNGPGGSSVHRRLLREATASCTTPPILRTWASIRTR
jgi:cell division septation protein DedD